MLSEWLFLLILLPGAAYWALAWWAVRGHLRQRETPDGSFAPRVSVLKPVRGVEVQSHENFASFCRQNYPNYEILFGVREENDPAIPIVERVRKEFPELSIRIVRASAVGANPKVSTLRFLAAEATGEILAISDADVRVKADYLRQVVAPLEDPAVGVVTCPYRGLAAGNWVSRLGGLYMGTTFLPSAVLAHGLMGVRVGLGATIAIRREDLKRAGGFEAIADYLADDYQLASHIADLGLRIHLSKHVVRCVLGPMSLGEQWDRELRWMRGIRVTRPLEYPGLLLTFLTVQAMVLAISLAPLDRLWLVGLVGLGLAMGLRWLVAWRIMRYLGQEQIWRDLLWLPARDLMTAAAWGAGLFGRTVVWRDGRYELMRDGRLRPSRREEGPNAEGPLERAIRRLDKWLREKQGIFEYCDDPECITRVGIERAKETVELSDGTRIERGQQIGELHFWNEHLPRIPASGPGLAWANTARRRLRKTLRVLAERMQSDARLKSVQAFHACIAFVPKDRPGVIMRILGMHGFEQIEPKGRMSWGARLHRFGENMLITGLLWTFNPFNGTRLTQHRYHVWISRGTMLRLHGGTTEARAVSQSLGGTAVSLRRECDGRQE